MLCRFVVVTAVALSLSSLDIVFAVDVFVVVVVVTAAVVVVVLLLKYNKESYANYNKGDGTPSYYGSISCIYTKKKHFYPLLQVLNR